MITTLSTNQAIHALLADDTAEWTYNEAESLVNYYEELEDEQGVAKELDLAEIRSDWTRATEEEVRGMYSIEGDVKEYLDDHGYCLEVEQGSFLFLNF